MAITHSPDDRADNSRKAFDMADAWAKHIATLATGTLVLSATFLKDVLPNDANVEWSGLLYSAWTLLVVSTVLGLVVLGALMSGLSRADQKLDIYAPSIRLSGFAQIATFLLGICLFALFVGLNL